MYLGAKDGATDWEEFGGVNPVAEALGISGTGFEAFVQPYFIALFTPFLICAAFVVKEVLPKYLA